jgi:hypothetical protein
MQRINPPMHRSDMGQTEFSDSALATPTAETMAPLATRSSPVLVEGSANVANTQPGRSHRTIKPPAVVRTASPITAASSPAVVEGSANAANPQPRRSHQTIKPLLKGRNDDLYWKTTLMTNLLHLSNELSNFD